MTAAETWYIRGEGGDIIPMDLPLGEGIPGRLASGALVRVNPDGSPYEEPASDAPEAAPAPARKRRAPKAEADASEHHEES